MPGFVNAEQIQQVILNLVINSMDAIKQGGKIVISIVHIHKANILQISVEDNGPGVEPEVKNKLFEPFYTTKQEGLGLGLYTSREIIEQHKGKLLLKDSVLGGARFEILLPSEGIE